MQFESPISSQFTRFKPSKWETYFFLFYHLKKYAQFNWNDSAGKVWNYILLPCFIFKVVSASRLPGVDNPLEIVYFVEGPSGQRVSAVQTASLLNSLDVQRAAIVLGYRIQGILAQREYSFTVDNSYAQLSDVMIKALIDHCHFCLEFASSPCVSRCSSFLPPSRGMQLD